MKRWDVYAYSVIGGIESLTPIGTVDDTGHATMEALKAKAKGDFGDDVCVAAFVEGTDVSDLLDRRRVLVAPKDADENKLKLSAEIACSVARTSAHRPKGIAVVDVDKLERSAEKVRRWMRGAVGRG